MNINDHLKLIYNRGSNFGFFVISFILSYFVIQFILSHYIGDLNTHLVILQKYVAAGKWPGNFLYYLTVYLFSFITRSEQLSVAILLGLAVAARVYITLWLINKVLDKKLETFDLTINVFIKLLFALLVLCHSMVLTFNLNQQLYLGTITPNVWHNSTWLFMMPFALLLFYFSYKYLLEGKTDNWLLILILIVINISIKPSFFFCFGLSFPLLCLIRFKFTKKSLIVVLITFLGFLILGLQYIYIYKFDNVLPTFYNNESSKIIFQPFLVWNAFSKNILFDLMKSISFPILVYLLYYKYAKNNLLLKYSLINYIFALLIFVLFAESGPRLFHGNLIWQTYAAAYILFFSSLIVFVTQLNVKKFKFEIRDFVVMAAYLLHIQSGILYLAKIFTLNNYL